MDIKKEYIAIPDYALAVMNRLRDAGEEVYIVGGCVRDALLGISPHDYDMAVSCPPERTLEILSHLRTVPTGLRHGTITAVSQGNPIELTTFRIDGSYTDMRRPDSVSFASSIAEDLSRRDFTVNAMAYSHETSLVDLFGGREDLDAKILRAVGEPKKRFCEDALRIMRAFRFSAQLGFEIEENTLSAAHECKEGLESIAVERIRAEFLRLICSPYSLSPLLLMKKLGILTYVSKDYAPSDELIALIAEMPNCEAARLGFYFCESSRELAASMISRLRCSNKEKSGALAVVTGARTKFETPYDIRKLRARFGEHAGAVLHASVLLGYTAPEMIAVLEDEHSPSTLSELALNGKDLSKLGIQGRDIGEMMEYLLGEVIREPSLNTREELLSIADRKRKEKEE